MKVKIKPEIIFFYFAIVFLFGSSFFSSAWYVLVCTNYALRVMLLILSISVFCMIQLVKKKKNVLPMWIYFLLICMASVILYGYFTVGYSFEPALKYIFTLIFLACAMRDSRWLKAFWVWIMISACVFVFTTIWLWLDLNSYFSLFANNLYPNEWRFESWAASGYTAGITDHYSSNGMALAIATTAGGAMAIQSFVEKDKKSTALKAVFFLLCLVALFLTGKRAHLLFSCIGMLVSLYFYGSKEKNHFLKYVGYILVISVLVTLASAFIPQVANVLERFQNLNADSNVLYRYDFWKAAIQSFSEHPILGIGWGGFREVIAPTIGYSGHCHNIYIQLLCETGIIGTTIFTVWFIISYISAIKVVKIFAKRNNDNPVINIVLAIFSLTHQTYFLLYGLTGNPLFDEYEYPIYFISCIISIHYAYHAKKMTGNGELKQNGKEEEKKDRNIDVSFLS